MERNMPIRRLIATLALFTLVSTLSHAQVSGEDMATSSDRAALYNAKKSELEALSKVLDIEAEIRKKKESGTATVQPTLRSIEGIDGHLVATFAFSDSANVDAKKGDQIPGGWTVTSISLDSVDLKRGKETLHLLRSDTAGQAVIRPASAGLPLPTPITSIISEH